MGDVEAIILRQGVKGYGGLKENIYYRVVEIGRDWFLTANGYYVPKSLALPKYIRRGGL